MPPYLQGTNWVTWRELQEWNGPLWCPFVLLEGGEAGHLATGCHPHCWRDVPGKTNLSALLWCRKVQFKILASWPPSALARFDSPWRGCSEEGAGLALRVPPLCLPLLPSSLLWASEDSMRGIPWSLQSLSYSPRVTWLKGDSSISPSIHTPAQIPSVLYLQVGGKEGRSGDQASLDVSSFAWRHSGPLSLRQKVLTLGGRSIVCICQSLSENYQTTWPASWEICMQVGKQQLELDMEQQTGSK